MKTNKRALPRIEFPEFRPRPDGNAGITVDASELEAMGSKFTEQLAGIEQTIYQEAGEEFNIGSPKQLGQILFEKMGLPYQEDKTGYSGGRCAGKAGSRCANCGEYSALPEDCQDSIDLRGGPLKVLIPGRRSTRLQTLTQIGRLSSVDTTENIPVQEEEGRAIRKAFVPQHEAGSLRV